jgi:hypothetical protein
MPTFVHDYADLVSWIGLVVSIVGMLLTIWTLVTAQGIKAKLMRRFQLPQLVRDLQDGLTDLNRILSAATLDSQALKEIISRLFVTLESAQRKAKRQKVAEAASKAKILLSLTPLTREHGNAFILEMTRAHQEVILEYRDDPWNI